VKVLQKKFWLDDPHQKPLRNGLLFVDAFAGGGGASTGIRQAIGRDVDIAINHDRTAIAMHMRNHPSTRHYCENIWQVDPVEVTEGRTIGAMWASPDCTHFSKARGKKPVSKDIRALAQSIIPWASMDVAVRPRVIFVENVTEFQTWGPVDAAGKPIKARAGETFKLWVCKLQELGYAVEWRELVASDFGAPTTRKRLFIIARCDGRPIVWPEPSHGSPAQIAKELKSNRSCRRRKWRTAADIVDFNIPCPSIFLSPEEAKAQGCKRPLADKTMARIAEGIRRYVIETATPFIVTVNHSGTHFRGHSIDRPMSTMTNRNGFGLVTPFLSTYYGPKGGDSHRGRSLFDPVPTVTTENRFGVVSPYMVSLQNGGSVRSPLEPLRTITASDGDCNCIVTPLLASTANQGTTGRAPYCWDAQEPVRTLTTTGDKVLVSPIMSRMFGKSIGNPVTDALGTVTSENKSALVSAFIVKHFGGMVGIPIDRPFPTVTTIGTQNQIVAATMISLKHGQKQWFGADEPVRTVCAGGNHHAIVEARMHQVRAFLFRYFGSGGQWSSCHAPTPTITAKDRLALGIVLIGGSPYQIVDIGMRMFTPRELFAAQGFPSDYQIEAGEDGKPLSKSAQVARCGNSVPPAFAAALVRANCPDLCGVAL
jgi:DNA (cytosine-5)-methyltransferase 1